MDNKSSKKLNKREFLKLSIAGAGGLVCSLNSKLIFAGAMGLFPKNNNDPLKLIKTAREAQYYISLKEEKVQCLLCKILLGAKMNSEELQNCYLNTYKQIFIEYFPEADKIFDKIAQNYDLTHFGKQSGSLLSGRKEFVSKLVSMASCFIGAIETSRLEKELGAVKVDLSKDL